MRHSVIHLREQPVTAINLDGKTAKHLVRTELDKSLSNSIFDVEAVTIPFRKPVHRELSLVLLVKTRLLSSSAIIAAQGTALRLAAIKSLHISVPRIIAISYDPFPGERPFLPENNRGNLFRASFSRQLRINLLRRVDSIIFHSERQLKWVEQQLGDSKNLFFVPMSVDLDCFYPGDQRMRADYLLVTDGGLRDYRLIHDAVRLLSTKPDEIVVVQRNPLRPEALTYLTRIAALDVKVTIKSQISTEKLAELYRKSRIVLIPIKPSGQPAGLTQLLESAASGCAIVSSGGPLLEEYLTPNREFLSTPPGDASAFAQALDEIMHSPQLANRLGAAASTRAQDYTFERSINAIRSVIEQAIIK